MALPPGRHSLPWMPSIPAVSDHGAGVRQVQWWGGLCGRSSGAEARPADLLHQPLVPGGWRARCCQWVCLQAQAASAGRMVKGEGHQRAAWGCPTSCRLCGGGSSLAGWILGQSVGVYRSDCASVACVSSACSKGVSPCFLPRSPLLGPGGQADN